MIWWELLFKNVWSLNDNDFKLLFLTYLCDIFHNFKATIHKIKSNCRHDIFFICKEWKYIWVCVTIAFNNISLKKGMIYPPPIGILHHQLLLCFSTNFNSANTYGHYTEMVRSFSIYFGGYNSIFVKYSNKPWFRLSVFLVVIAFIQITK